MASAELLGGLFEEDGKFGWYIVVQTPDGEMHQKYSDAKYKTITKAEAALDAEIEKVSKSFAEQGAEILSKNGILYA